MSKRLCSGEEACTLCEMQERDRHWLHTQISSGTYFHGITLSAQIAPFAQESDPCNASGKNISFSEGHRVHSVWNWLFSILLKDKLYTMLNAGYWTHTFTCTALDICTFAIINLFSCSQLFLQVFEDIPNQQSAFFPHWKDSVSKGASVIL